MAAWRNAAAGYLKIFNKAPDSSALAYLWTTYVNIIANICLPTHVTAKRSHLRKRRLKKSTLRVRNCRATCLYVYLFTIYYQLIIFRDKLLGHFHRRDVTMQYIAVPQYILIKPTNEKL